MHPQTRAAASWARSGRMMAEVLGLISLAQQTTKEIVARPAVKQRLQDSHGRGWTHRLLRAENNSRMLEDVAVEMCEIALANANSYELHRYAAFCLTVAARIEQSRARGELPRESARARRIRELDLEHRAQVAAEKARDSASPDLQREAADAQERDGANDLSEATLARIAADEAERASRPGAA
jgi:hypothetical protein